jgi:hypothetical protein
MSSTLPSHVADQQDLLRKLLKVQGGCSLFSQLGLGRLGSFRDFDLLYQGFCRAVPVQGPKVFIDSLAKMLPQNNLAPLQVLQSPNLLVRGLPAAATAWRGIPLPVAEPALEDHLNVEIILRRRLQEQGMPVRGSFFYLFEQEIAKTESSSGVPLPVPLQGWHALVAGMRAGGGSLTFKAKNILEFMGVLPRKVMAYPSPQTMPRGGSRWQWFNAMQDVMRANGAQIDVLVASPRTLIDFGLYVSQQAGRFVPLRELLPNLQVLALNHYDISLQRTELFYLLQGMPHVRWVQWLYQPTGLQAWQGDMNIRQRLELKTDGQAFYEFIPVEDIDPSGRFTRAYRRFHVGQVEVGKEYCLAVSTLSGLLGVSTGQVVKVMTTDPLQVIARGPVVQLNGLGEGLREDAILEAIGNINSALNGQGVFVREALFGHIMNERTPFWVVELSRPLSELPDAVLESIARRMHTELDLRSEKYRMAYRMAHFGPPQVHFVPMGSFAAAFTHAPEFTQFDHSPDASLCKRILAAAWESKMKEAV